MYGNEVKAHLTICYPHSTKGKDADEKLNKFFNNVTVSDDGIKFGNSSVKNIYNFEFSILSDTESLTIEGDATIDTSSIRGLKEIDTTKSRKYHAENGILYHTVNDQIGTKGEKISEIPLRSTDLG